MRRSAVSCFASSRSRKPTIPVRRALRSSYRGLRWRTRTGPRNAAKRLRRRFANRARAIFSGRSQKSVIRGGDVRAAARALPARGAKREVCRAIAASNAARLSIRSPALLWPACTRRIAGSIRREPWSKGESLAKAAERCQIHPSTAFRWRHRFLAALKLDKPKSLSGVVEADETFILESFKGRRSGLARPARRRG